MIPTPDNLEALIRPAVQLAVSEAVGRAVEAAKEQVALEIRRQIGNIVLQVLSYYSVERHGNTLVIKVELPK